MNSGGMIVVALAAPVLEAGLVAAIAAEGRTAARASATSGRVPAAVVDAESVRRVDAERIVVLDLDGGPGWDATVSELLAALDGSEVRTSDRASSTGPDVLTDRERELVTLVARGWTNRRVADELGISPHTVRTHLHNAMAKLDVSSRHALAAIVEEMA